MKSLLSAIRDWRIRRLEKVIPQQIQYARMWMMVDSSRVNRRVLERINKNVRTLIRLKDERQQGV